MAIQNESSTNTNNTIDTYFEMTGADTYTLPDISLINFIQVQIQGLSTDEVFVEINGNSDNMDWIQLFDKDGVNPFNAGSGLRDAPLYSAQAVASRCRPGPC